METIAVYKTDLDDVSTAQRVLDEIRSKFPGCDPSIDLDDCDNVLRIEYPALEIDELSIDKIFAQQGYNIEPLP